MISDGILRGNQKLTLYTHEATLGMAHYIQMPTYAEYTHDATDLVDLKSRSEGEKVAVIPNTFI